jgi:preprotein translocase subunit SecF
MLIAIISTIIAIVLFLCLYFAFREGLRLGMNVSKGKDIEPLKTPIKAIQEHKANKETEKANKEFQDELSSIMGYTGDEPEG